MKRFDETPYIYFLNFSSGFGGLAGETDAEVCL
jgi:hypothetical protein